MSGGVGSTIAGRYEVLRVHPGGMGVVSIVRDRESGEMYAAKSIREDLREDPRVRRRFQREVETWIRLGTHPNLVAALFVREDGDIPWLFLEYIAGPTLATLLSRQRPIHPLQALDLAAQFALGMLFAHEQALGEGRPGVIHRDLKPANLFVTHERIGKVSDFGIAKLRTPDLGSTAEGVGVGTPLYVSPEQLKGSRTLDGRADVYSFGAVLYEMLTGRVPLRADSLESQIYLILRRDPAPPSVLTPGLPSELDDLVLSCLAKSPADRPAGFRPVISAIDRLLADSDWAAPPASSCPECGYSSGAAPGPCPLCDARTGPARPFVARFGEVEEIPEKEPLPANLTISGVAIEPAVARVGERVTIRVSIRNHGTVAARQVELPRVVPDRDVFTVLSPDEVWRGEIPPTGMGRPYEVTWSFVPLREGSFVLPAFSLRYQVAQETAPTVTWPGGEKLTVTLNFVLPMVGRERDWELLTAHLAREDATFSLVTSAGGGGRSRFVDEAGEWAGANGRLVLKGKALERGGQPLKVFHDIARRIFGVTGAALDSRGMMARVIDRLAPLVGEDPALAGFFSFFLRGAPVTEAQARMRGYLWFRLLSALAAENPVVLLLTDLQWGDEESIDLMEGIIRRAREDGVPISIIVSSIASHRDERTQRRIASIKERAATLSTEPGLVLRVDLGPLGRDAVRTLLDVLFPGNTLDEDHPWLVPTLTRQSGGNPFHLMQILRLLRAAKDAEGEPLVSAEGGSWTIRPELTEDSLSDLIPKATDGMVRAVVDSLPDGVNDVLARAAVIGAEFPLDLLGETVPDEDLLDRGLRALERSDLIRATNREGTRYRFTNSIVPAIVLRREQERSLRSFARLHRDIARAMESTLSRSQLNRRALAYARHLRFAGESGEALRWYVSAADRYVREQLYLRARRALHGAEFLFDEGVTPPKGVRGTFHYLRGEVARVTGDLSGALTAFGEAIDHLSREEQQSLLAAALSRMGRIHEARGEPDRAVYCYQVAAEVRQEIGDRADAAHSENDLGSVHLLRGEDEEAGARFARAREIATETGNRSALGKALDQLAALAVRRYDWEEAEDLYRVSFDLGEEAYDRIGMAHSLNGLGGIAVRRGDLEEATRLYRKALTLRREVGDREGIAVVLSNLGVIQDRGGHYEEALRIYRRAVLAHRAIGSRRGLATVLNNIGVVNLTRGDVGIALEHFEEALRIRREIGDRARIGSALTNLAEARALAGETVAAEQFYREAGDLLRAAGDPSGEASALTGRARLLRRAGKHIEAEDALEAALGTGGRDLVVRAALHLEAAEQHSVRGERNAARAAARRGFSLAEEIGDLEAQAQACRIEAGNREGGPGDALSLLERAEGLLKGTSGPELARVLLERSGLLAETEPRRSREILMRARGLLDAMEARGAVLPERECVERLLSAEAGTD